MENSGEHEEFIRQMQYWWNQYLVSTSRKLQLTPLFHLDFLWSHLKHECLYLGCGDVSRMWEEKVEYFQCFLADVLKICHVVKGDANKIMSLCDIHSVSNMIAREFQTIILAKCQECDEELLVKYLCGGQGLMLLEVLYILATKIAGCSSELANLLVTLLPVILRIPPGSHDVRKELVMTVTEWESHYNDSKVRATHSNYTKDQILSHCKERYEHALKTFQHSASEEDLPKCRAETLTEDSTEILLYVHGREDKEKLDSASTTGDSDGLTSISSMGSASLQSSTVSDSSHPEPAEKELHRQSSGVSSTLGSLEASFGVFLGKTTALDGGIYSLISDSMPPRGPSPNSGEEISFEVNTFELLLLLLSILEKLCCRDMSNQDASLLMQTSGQLIDLVISLSGAECKGLMPDELEVECSWEGPTATSAQLATLKTVFTILNTACRSPKCAKQLTRSAYISTLTQMIEDIHNKVNFLPDQFDELVEELESVIKPEQSHELKSTKLILWTKFQPVLFVSQSLKGLTSFLCSALHFGTLINTSMLALMQELLEQFSSNSGFHFAVTVGLKLEEMLTPSCRGCEKGSTREDYPNSETTSEILRSFPRTSISYILTNIGKTISLIKKGKRHCQFGMESSSRRKSYSSSSQQMIQFNAGASEVEESSESAGDMEEERKSTSLQASAEVCPVLPPVSSLLALFKGCRTQFISSQVLACLSKVGVCSCLNPDELVTSLLARFHNQPRFIQSAVLKTIPQLVLTEIDINSTAFHSREAPPNYTNKSRRPRRTSKSPKSSPSRSDSASEAFARYMGFHGQSSETMEPHSWSCFSQYCALLTCGNPVVAVEAARSLRLLVNLGSVELKEELFRVVILPSILRSDSRNKIILPGLTISSFRNSTPENSISHNHPALRTESSEEKSSQKPRSPASPSGIAKDVLRILIGYLPCHLTSENSRSLFLSCGGLTELQSFLAVPELQELVISVFEFLATLEDRARAKFREVAEKRTKDGDHVTDGHRKEDSETAIKAFLNLLQFTARLDDYSSDVTVITTRSSQTTTDSPQQPSADYSSEDRNYQNKNTPGDEEPSVKIDTSEKTTEQSTSVDKGTAGRRLEIVGHAFTPLSNISLRIHVWKACLNLIVSNKTFLDLFVERNGAIYSYELLKWLLESFQNQMSCEVSDEERKDFRETVALFEAVLAVCIRLAYAGLWQDQGTLPSVDSLQRSAERVFRHSPLVKELIGRGLCDSFTKAAAKSLFPTPIDTHQGGAEEGEAAPFHQEEGAEGSGEWPNLLMEDEFDALNGGKRSTEDGYEADNEVNSDSSEEHDEKIVRQRKPVRERRRSMEVKPSSVYYRGLVAYPQICKFMLNLLHAAFKIDTGTEQRKVFMLTHAAQCLLGLVKDCEQNCKVLCEQGLIGTILLCYNDVLRSEEESLQDLQSIVLDVFVNLATHKIRAAELWEFVQLFKSESLPWDLLCGSLALVASKASSYPGPAYMLTFPCLLHTVESRFRPTGRRAYGQRTQAKSSRKGWRGKHQFDSPGDASSEGAGSEASLMRAKPRSPVTPRSRRHKTHSKHGGHDLMDSSRPRSSSLRDDMKRSASLPCAIGEGWDAKEPHPGLTDDSADLPSPFTVKAGNLRFQGNLPLPSSGFSIALWVRFHNLKRYMEWETVGGKEEVRLRSGSLRFPPGFQSKSNTLTGESTGLRGSTTPGTEEAIHLCSFGSRRSLFEMWILPSSGCVLFRWTKSTKGGTDGYDIIRELVTRVSGLNRGRWHHLVVSFAQAKHKHAVVDDLESDEPHRQACKILTIVDGTERQEHNFGPPLPWHEDAKCLLSIVLLGHVTLRTSRDKTSETSTEGYDLGNLQVFTDASRHSKFSGSNGAWVIDGDGAFYLFSLGPNATSVGHLEKDLTLVSLKQSDPTKPFLVASKLWSRLSINERAVATELSPGYLTSPHVVIPDVEASVKEKLLLSYSPAHHTVFQQNVRFPVVDDRSRRFSSPESFTRSPTKQGLNQSEARLFMEVECVRCSSLLEAAHDVGGISVFIYLFAKVVESSEDPRTQSNGLSVILSLQKNCEYHSRTMDEESGYELLKRILLSPQCKIGYHVLKVLMEAACDGDVFKHTSLSDNPIMLNIDSNAVVRNVDIFTHYLLNWKVWEKAKQGVLEMLLSTLEILVHSSHPHYQFNIIQFQKAELVQQLLIGCQERQGEGFKEIPATISTLYVNIISNIMGNPPDLTVLKAVCEFLIAIHSTEDTTRLHSPTRFYLAEHSFDFGPLSPYRSSPTSLPVRRTLSSPASQLPRSSLSPTANLVMKTPHSQSSPSNQSDTVEDTGSSTSDSREREGTLVAKKNRGDEAGAEVETKEGRKSNSNQEHTEKKGDDIQSVIPHLESLDSSSIGSRTPDQLDESGGQVDRTHGQRDGAQDQLDRTGDSIDGTHDHLLTTPYKVSSSCPQLRTKHGLTVKIPRSSTFCPAPHPVSLSASAGGLLLEENHFREGDFVKYSSSVSPATPQTPLDSWKGPGSQPVSIERSRISARDGQSSVDVQEYDFINESDFSSLRSSLAHPSSTDEYLVVDGFPGIKSSTRTYRPFNNSETRRRLPDNMAKMRLGLLKLLQKVLFSLQAEQVPAVIGGVLKAEYLLVWVSHDSDPVRELVIKILCLFLQKAEPEQCSHFIRCNGYHLLANQLYDYVVTKGIAEACLSLLVGRQVDLQKDYAYSDSTDGQLLETVRPLGVVPLLALLENSLAYPHIFRLLVKHLCQLFIKVDDLCLQAGANGLLQTICNVICGLSRIEHKKSSDPRLRQVDVGGLLVDVQDLIACIVRKACCTCGSLFFQMFEDLLVVLENLEEWDHRKSRDYGSSVSYMARYLRYFAVQVALHFFQEICKEEAPISRKGKKNTGIRLPFRSESAECLPFSPVSSWVNLSKGGNESNLDPRLLKSSPTRANFNEQSRRFQSVIQTALNFVIYSKTFFITKECNSLQFYAADLQVHEVLQPAVIKGVSTGVDISKEFTQFVFSLLLEFLETCLDGKRSATSKLFYVAKDVIKSQMGKLLVHLLSPGQPPELSYFALQLTNHRQAKKLLYSLITSSGGGKQKERLVSYIPKLVTNPKFTDEQQTTAKCFLALLESCGLRVMTIGDDAGHEETSMWDQVDTSGMVEWQKKRADAYKPLSQRIVALGSQVTASASDVTRLVLNVQDGQRQALLKHNRDALSAEVQIRKKWRQLMERITHEKSIWYDTDFFPTSWRLDPTEGPSRVRCRLQRCHLDIDDRFIMDEYRNESDTKGNTPLAYLFEDTTFSTKRNVYYIFDTPDTIRGLYHCKNITLDIKTQGVILIGDSHMYFVGEEAITDTDITQILLGNKDTISLSWSNDEIQEIRSRRYCLQDIGIEVFLTNGRTYLLAFETKNDRDVVLEEFKQRSLPIHETPVSEHLYTVTAKWRAGNLSNFEYLTELNKMAGRTCNDLMQYPVFPFVLSDFTSEVLDLNDVKVLRDLSKPIAVQNPLKEVKYRETFRWLKEEFERQGEMNPLAAPYHYGSHYSNSGTVLHFLVRLPPFTSMFLQYQDRNFDIPDRTFHSMATTWRLSSFESSTDVKELIPEFFFLPEFLENFEGFDFGFRQNGVRVMNVTLPPWAKSNPRLFVLIHRQALETDYVSQHLNEWIDLVFGFKQTGTDAVEAINVFHPATYFGVDVDAITDPIRKKALKTMIETYGQTPRQLFNFPHSPRLVRKPQGGAVGDAASMTSTTALKFDMEVASFTGNFINRFTSSFSSDNTFVGSIADTLIDIPKPVTTVEGIRWGQYVGSPALPAPVLATTQPLSTPATTLVCDRGDKVYILCTDTTLVTVYQKSDISSGTTEAERIIMSAVLSWATMDGSLSIYHSGSSSSSFLMDIRTPDKITSCAITTGCRSLFIGSSSGSLSVMPIKHNPALDTGLEVLGTRVRLYGHRKAITCLHICHEFSIVVSASQDGRAIIWDLNRLSYVRSLEHSNAVTAVAVSRTSGDIATVSHAVEMLDSDSLVDEGSELYLWTVNGRPIGHQTCEHTINCVDFSRAQEGLSVNVIATGLSNGAIRLWSTWDLQHIRDIAPEQHLHPIAAVAFSEDSQRLFALSTHNKLMVWQRRDRIYPKQSSLVTFPASYCSPRTQSHEGRTKADG